MNYKIKDLLIGFIIFSLIITAGVLATKYTPRNVEMSLIDSYIQNNHTEPAWGKA